MPPEIIAVLSQSKGSGKTTVALNLAFALEARGYRVLLVDATTVKPSIGGLLGVRAPDVGFTDLLEGKASPRDVITRYKGTNLFLILGKSGPNPRFSYANVARLLVGGVRLISYDFMIADGPTPLPGRSFAIPYDVLLVSKRTRANVQKAIVSLKLQMRTQGVPTQFVVNTTKAGAAQWDDEYGVADAILPYEAKMKKCAKAKTPIYLSDRKSGFSRAIDQLADIYVKKRTGR